MDITDFLVEVKSWIFSITWVQVTQAYEAAKHLFELVVLFLCAVTALRVLRRLPKIIELLREFRENRSPIFALLTTAQELKELVPTIEEKLQALQKQVIAIQLHSANNRVQSSSATAADPQSDDDWDSIKKMWSDARDKLEAIIDSADGRRKRKYEKIERYDYTTVIQTLAADGLISKSIEDDALHMYDEFQSLRNRKRPITDEIKRKFCAAKKQFDEETSRFKPQIRSIQSSDRAVSRKGNGSADGTAPKEAIVA